MIAAEVMVPCFSFAPRCNLDWAAISAVGGWVAAIVTFFAVLLPFRQYRKEFKLRAGEEATDAEIAARGSVIALTSIHTGLEKIRHDLKEPEGFSDFPDSIGHIRSFISNVPPIALPRSPKLRNVRVGIASLEVTLASLKIYVAECDEGKFDAGSVEQYLVTVDLACGFFNRVVKELDVQFPDFKFADVLERLDEGSF